MFAVVFWVVKPSTLPQVPIGTQEVPVLNEKDLSPGPGGFLSHESWGYPQSSILDWDFT